MRNASDSYVLSSATPWYKKLVLRDEQPDRAVAERNVGFSPSRQKTLAPLSSKLQGGNGHSAGGLPAWAAQPTVGGLDLLLEQLDAQLDAR
eukprot:7388787-Prymnesium_polylepis.1